MIFIKKIFVIIFVKKIVVFYYVDHCQPKNHKNTLFAWKHYMPYRHAKILTPIKKLYSK